MNRRILMPLLLVLATLSGGFLAGRASAAQPHMVSALEHLRAAKAELDAAMADKGGHREKALRLVNDAIAQVERGIEYAHNH
jgi:hypothetical protein